MRRALASLLLALFSIPLIFVTLVDGAASSLPACCLRDGKHRCMLTDGSESAPSGAQLRAIQPKCPLFPRAGAVPGFSQSASLASAVATLSFRIEHAPAASTIDRPVSLSCDRFPHKRGPPTQLL